MSDYQAVRRLVYERDKGRCVVCLEAVTTGSVHHRQGRGGKDPHRLSNCLLVCGTGTTGCHGRIHSNPAWAYENGYMVRRLGVDTPETVPVRYGDLMVHLINDVKESA